MQNTVKEHFTIENQYAGEGNAEYCNKTPQYRYTIH